MLDLQLSHKVSPKAYTLDKEHWIPVVMKNNRPLSPRKRAVKLETDSLLSSSGTNGHTEVKENGD